MGCKSPSTPCRRSWYTRICPYSLRSNDENISITRNENVVPYVISGGRGLFSLKYAKFVLKTSVLPRSSSSSPFTAPSCTNTRHQRNNGKSPPVSKTINANAHRMIKDFFLIIFFSSVAFAFLVDHDDNTKRADCLLLLLRHAISFGFKNKTKIPGADRTHRDNNAGRPLLWRGYILIRSLTRHNDVWS